jgi:hypothetical protein
MEHWEKLEYYDDYNDLMKLLGKKKCYVCNCWVFNLKRHYLTNYHFKMVDEIIKN